jgi:predicted nucleic acid-binding protein
MIAYCDASVLLRRLLHQANTLVVPAVTGTYSSMLLKVECRRTIDRMRLMSVLDDERISHVLALFATLCESIRFVEVEPHILERAGRPLPVTLGTLDAIHLATAMALSEGGAGPVTMFTHDHQLALAARSLGLTVVGDG